ncbi:hypothetical protein P3T24_005745 [Paraburkholderia sp. GAS33]
MFQNISIVRNSCGSDKSFRIITESYLKGFSAGEIGPCCGQHAARAPARPRSAAGRARRSAPRNSDVCPGSPAGLERPWRANTAHQQDSDPCALRAKARQTRCGGLPTEGRHASHVKTGRPACTGRRLSAAREPGASSTSLPCSLPHGPSGSACPRVPEESRQRRGGCAARPCPDQLSTRTPV